MKECRLAPNHSFQEIAAHEGLTEELAVIDFLAAAIGYAEDSGSGSSGHIDLTD